MVSAAFITLALTIPVLSATSGCAPSDLQCSAQLDASSMIQVNSVSTESVSTPEAAKLEVEQSFVAKYEDKAAELIALAKKMFRDDPEESKGKEEAAEWKKLMSEYFPTGTKMTFGERVGYGVTSWIIYVVLGFLMYKCCYPGPPEVVSNTSAIEDPQKTMTEGHFRCLQSPEICLCACFCPGVRWADTMMLVNLLSILVGLGLVYAAFLLNIFAYAAVVYGPFSIVLFLYFRHKLREVFGMKAFTCETCCIDAIYIICCPWCAVAQEARAVNHALQKGSIKAPA